MGVQSERKNKAAQNSKPEAATMRTVIATILSVLTAATLVKLVDNPQPIVVAPVEHRIVASEQKKPAPTPATDPVVETSLTSPDQKAVVETPAVAPQAAPAGTCAAEIDKYSSWNQNTAHAVMMAESSGNANTQNDNVMTGDYSIGCFQINLLGANLGSKYRLAVSIGYAGEYTQDALTAWLKDPVNNVRIANTMYNIATNWGDWKYTCQTKVLCL